MSNPKNCTKKSLLLAIAEVNTRCGTKLRVTSKSITDIIDATEMALQDVTCLDMLTKLTTPTLGELICWGFIDTKFLGEQDVPAFVEQALDDMDDNTVQAGELKEWDEDAAQAQEETIDAGEEEVDESKLSKKERKALKKARKKAAKLAKNNPPEPEVQPVKEPAPKEKSPLMDPGEVQGLAKRDLQLLAGELGVDLELKKKKMVKACVVALIAAHEPPAEKKKKKAGKRSGPGVIISIKGILEDTDTPLTFEGILEQLVERVPNGNPDTMIKTIRAQVAGKQPCRMELEKDCVIKVKGEKNERTFIIK